jgi:hypothetical protein
MNVQSAAHEEGGGVEYLVEITETKRSASPGGKLRALGIPRDKINHFTTIFSAKR